MLSDRVEKSIPTEHIHFFQQQKKKAGLGENQNKTPGPKCCHPRKPNQKEKSSGRSDRERKEEEKKIK